jgi:hypothetical protein
MREKKDYLTVDGDADGTGFVLGLRIGSDEGSVVGGVSD